MPSINKPFVRLAMAIHEQLSSAISHPLTPDLPICSWEHCNALVRQIRRAQFRGWHLATQQLRRELQYAVIDVSDRLAAVREQLPRSALDKRVTSSADIYADLIALQDDFTEVAFNLQHKSVSITTDPITLDGIYLGTFEVRLSFAQIGNGHGAAYRVVATDPHPAEGRDNVTHPHVMDELLCEGDGRHAIKQALSQGRLLDFFSLVTGVLRTYNSESPFVELALWHGSTCSDCGERVNEDYSHTCQRCGGSVCDECEVLCGGCEESCCSGCVGACAVCEENFCRRCLKICQGCHRHVCEGCLDKERCSNCHEEDDDQDDTVATTECATVQPHRLGEASLSA